MWIHVPSTSCQYAAASPVLNWDSTQPWVAELARSVTWRTNSVSLRSLQRVWETVPSIQRLSGLTSEPSIQARGVAEWISSLGDSRASHFRSPESVSRSQTPETSGLPSPESSTASSPTESSWRMLQASCGITMNEFGETYERWVTRLRRASSQRQKQAHLTRESASSSWPTPSSEGSKGEISEDLERKGAKLYNKQTGRMLQTNLATETRNWPTPNAGPQNDSDTTWKERRQRIKEQGINGNGFGLTLGMAATNWPTPTTADTFTNNLESSQVREGSMHSVTLPRAAGNWPTQDSRSIPQAPTTTPDGHTCSPSCRRLSPRFVEMLMGLPLGWVISSEHLGMALYQQWERRLIENSAR